MALWNSMNYFAIFMFFLVVFPLDVPVDGRKHSPLIDDTKTHSRNRAAECVLGKQVKELGSSWFADLGPPFGVMYCIKCECVKMQKKRRIVARVQCRNIKSECPKITCDNPVLPPGSCCKTCPGDNIIPIVNDNPAIVPEENMKHYASLLTGRSSLVVKREDMLPVPVSINKNNVIATGRFTFHHKNLYYSFYVSDKAARPRFLQFVDDLGNILDEHTLSGPGIVTSLYQNVTRKICGVWRRIPKEYRKLLKDQKLFAVLVWGQKDQPEFTLSGQIMRYVGLGTELFSSLLEPAFGTDMNMMMGAGGTAMVSTSSSPTPSIHIAIVFNGIFMPNELSEVPLNITLSLEEKQQIILEEIKRVEKPAHELNSIEISSPVSAADLRLLTRGRLVLSIASVSRPDALRLSGAVITRATCELFQSTLTSTNSEKDHSLAHPSGLAWMFMNSEGALVYHIQVDIHNPVSLISLVDITAKRKTELADLTADYQEGWANGTLDKLGPRFLEPLYSGNLQVNIALDNQNTIRGRLIAKPVAEARDSPAPILLKRVNTILPSSVVGLGWFSIDNNCHIHYDLSLTGMSNYDKTMELYLLELPMLAPGAPVSTRLLEEFRGNQIENSGNEVHELNDEEAILLNSGVAYLEIREKDSRNILLKGMIKQIKVPLSCLPHYSADNTVPTNSNTMDGGAYPAANPPPPNSCYHEGRFYEESTDWNSEVEPCKYCFCQNGKVTCQMATCPVQNCNVMDRPKAARGECCAPCLNTTDFHNINSRGCHLGKYFHSPGSKWHPFLIPNGFDRCIECYCDPETLSVSCTRTQNVCYNQPIDSNTMSDGVPQIVLQSTTTTPNPLDILAAGGCKSGTQVIENGKEYHPKLNSLGEYKCVICNCKNGIVSCERLKCSKSCNQTTYRQRRNSIEASDRRRCCSCKRLRRHQHHRQHGQS